MCRHVDAVVVPGHEPAGVVAPFQDAAGFGQALLVSQVPLERGRKLEVGEVVQAATGKLEIEN